MKRGDLVRFKPHVAMQGLAILVATPKEYVRIVTIRPVRDPSRIVVANVSKIEVVSESR